jgi:ferredoxin
VRTLAGHLVVLFSQQAGLPPYDPFFGVSASHSAKIDSASLVGNTASDLRFEEPAVKRDREQFQITLVMPSGARMIGVAPTEHIWDAARDSGIILPAICHQGRCLTCSAQLLAPGEFDQSDSVSYFPQDRAAGFILPCTARPLSNLRIRTHLQNEMREYRKKCGLPAPYS